MKIEVGEDKSIILEGFSSYDEIFNHIKATLDSMEKYRDRWEKEFDGLKNKLSENV